MATSLSVSASETTLVAPTTLTYMLTNDNPSSTSLLDIFTPSENDKPAYKAFTEFTGSKTVTKVTNAEGDIIASLEWREMLPDKVAIRNKPSVNLSSWMKSGLLPLSPVTFQDDEGRKYQWKNVAAGLNLELYANDTPGGPIAAFCKSRVNRTANTSTPAMLIMTARAQEIAETCVVSFLFLEKKRRMREHSSQNRADVLGSVPLCTGRGMVSGGGV